MSRFSGRGGSFHHNSPRHVAQHQQPQQQQQRPKQPQPPQQPQRPKYPGITAPISTAPPKPEDLELTAKLEECLRSYDLFESEEEMAHRVNVLSQINVIAKEWIVQVSLDKKCTPDKAEQMSGKIFTFGSFRLGVHTKGERMPDDEGRTDAFQGLTSTRCSWLRDT